MTNAHRVQATPETVTAIPRRLSPMQEGMLVHHLAAAKSSGVDLEQIVFKLEEVLDVATLERAFAEVFDHTPLLRTRFEWEGAAHPVQIAEQVVAIPTTHYDLSSLDEHHQALRLQTLLQDDRRTDFDLRVAPLSRLGFVHHGQQRYTVVWTFHHILLDGRSFPLVLEDVFTAYDQLRSGQSVRLPERPDFDDFLSFEGDASAEQSERYYRDLLAGFTSPLPLEVGFCARGYGRASSRSVETQLSEDETNAIIAQALALDVTPNTLFQAGWALLLSRYSRQQDILFGVTRACRNPTIPDVKAMIGLLINTVPTRVQCPEEQTLNQWLQGVRQQQLEQRPHERVALSTIQTYSVLPPGTPLFETIAVLDDRSLQQRMRERGPRFASATFEYLGQTNFPLTLAGYLDPAMSIRLEFDPARYDKDTAQRLLTHFCALLSGIAKAQPQTRLAELSMISADERKRLLFDWNQTDKPFPEHLRLQDGFVAQAQRAPGAIAAVCEAEQWTYRDLDTASNRLANHLQALGVKRGDRVALCLPRSLELLSTLLGILKAGAAYVPVDPDHPQDRQRHMLEDAGAVWLITTEALTRTLGAVPCQVLCIDRDAAAIAAASSQSVDCPAEPTDVAYMIYTSGSTGKPKGVVVRHQAAVNLTDWVNETFAVGPRDRLLFVTSVCFDLSVYDVFGILAAGGSLHVATSELLRDPRRLCQVLSSGGITFWDSAPAALNQLVPFLPERAAQSTLRLVFLSGDWIPVPLPDRVRAAYPGAEVVSLGGATEATVWSNYYRIGRVEPQWPSIPYGRPIRNARYYVLSDRLKPLPIGVAGELFIGGLCLADGYHQRPELNREKFIPDPFDHRPGMRLYRTGDLARFMPDGNLEFLGRLDQQVKIRGYRVELGEIEAVINSSGSVATCVLDAPRDAGNERTLVAYLVPKESAPPIDVARLRAHCQERLPEYMVPAHFIELERLPITQNGKLDRRALPAPKTEATTTYVAPRNELERKVAAIFERCLGVEQVGIHDDLFELGGHSLLAVRIIGAIQAELELEVSLRLLLQGRTVASVCAALSGEMQLSVSQIPRPIKRSPLVRLDAPETASFAQVRMAFIQQLDPESATYNIPLAFDVHGPLEDALLSRALLTALERHEPLRTAFMDTEDGITPEVLPMSQVDSVLSHVDLTDVPEHEQPARLSEVLMEAGELPFALEQAPLLRGVLVKLQETHHVLLLVVHHIVFDGASTGILQRDLLAAYDAELHGTIPALPPLPVRFNDYVVARRRLAEQEGFADDLAYFVSELSGTLPLLQLPHDHPRPAVLTYRGSTYTLKIPSELLSGLRRLSRTQNATTFMVLFAAYVTLLRRFTGQDDLVVGLPVSMRLADEVEGLIGLFINTVAVRVGIAPGQRFDDLIAQVKRKTMDALDHGEVPFEQLVETLAPPRDRGVTPLFQCLFSYQEATGRAYEGGGLKVTPRSTPQRHARTDLSLFLEDSTELGISGYFEYSTDLFDESTIARLSQGFITLLSQVVTHVDLPIDHAQVMSSAARNAEISLHNGIASDFDFSQTIVHRFENQAARAPNALAVTCGDRSLTYGQLQLEVNRLANTLLSSGLGQGRGVALFLDRSVEMLVSMLAVLKVGSYYIPLEPHHPVDRNALVLETAAPALVLSDEASAAHLPEHLDPPVLQVDRPGSGVDDNDPGVRTLSNGLAYVIFTSGSTGRPKGVEIAHRSLTNFLCSMAITPGMTAVDHMVSVTTLSFDIAVLELLLPMTVGASVDIVTRQAALSPRQLAERLALRPATLFQATPATYRMLLDDGWPGRPELSVLCGGEAMPPNLARELVPRVKALWNMYGPTETTVWSSVERVTDAQARITIGYPIHNTQMYVLNDALEPVPLGVPGHLYIGGTGLARGYHRNGKLTAEAFVTDPFCPMKTARMYRTGDLARRLPDGRLECLGRSDFQIKLRGFRIELGEVESALTRHPAVIQAVAHLQHIHGEPQLVGYVVCDPPTETVPTDLLPMLRERLPSYMVPSALVALRELPQTPNGKVDRKALPQPDRPVAQDGSTFVGPRDEREERVAALFRELLHVPHVDVNESFFDLGGHSLLAARLTRELSREFHTEVPLGSLFSNPTVARLAELVRSGGERAENAVLPLQRGADLPPLYFICGIHLYQELAQGLGDRQPSFGIYLAVEEHILDGTLRETPSVEDLARLYAKAVTDHCPSGPLSLCGVSFGAVLAYEMARQLRAAGREVLLLAMIAPVMPSSMSRNHIGWILERVEHLRQRHPSENASRAAKRLSPYLRRLLDHVGWPANYLDPMPISAPSGKPESVRGRVYRTAASAYDHREHHYEGSAMVIRAADERFDHFEVLPDLGWGRRIPNLRAFQAPGDHLGVLKDPATASIVRHELSQAYLKLNHHAPTTSDPSDGGGPTDRVQTDAAASQQPKLPASCAAAPPKAAALRAPVAATPIRAANRQVNESNPPPENRASRV